jgi:NAD(P)-dependent dehydrogenase (short-subunit alcohol dehydrogenase family)
MKITFKTALITGSSRGLGRAIAVKLAQEGVRKIAVHYLTRKNEAEKTVALLKQAGAQGVLVQGDTAGAQRAEEIVEEAA